MFKAINREELKSKLDRNENVVLIEALPAEYYHQNHLPGAININVDQVDELAPRLLTDKSAEVVVYCANRECPNSEMVAERLVELGYTNVYDYVDGKADWIRAGLPFERSAVAATA